MKYCRLLSTVVIACAFLLQTAAPVPAQTGASGGSGPFSDAVKSFRGEAK